jgi:DegV family protein with EDD domain
MKIFADSACDLSYDYLKENEVEVFPLTTLLDSGEFEDMIEIKSDKVYEMIARGGHPKTSQVSLDKFYKGFKQAAEAGESGIYPTLSAVLSGTYQAAVLAYTDVKAEFPDFDLRIIDTKSASLGEGLAVVEAIEMKDAGFGLDEIEARLRFIAEHTVSLFTVKDLNYLAEGGRLSKTSAFFGGLLNIHPLLELVDGKLVPSEKLRGRKKVMNRMYERLRDEAENIQEQNIFICHSDDQEAAEEMRGYIHEHFHPRQIIVHTIGSTISSHTGLGTLGLFFLNKFE